MPLQRPYMQQREASVTSSPACASLLELAASAEEHLLQGRQRCLVSKRGKHEGRVEWGPGAWRAAVNHA